MIGTLVNALAVVAGSAAGLALKRRIPEEKGDVVFTAVGLFTLYLGVSMALEAKSPVSLILGLLVGTLVGEAIGLEDALERLAEGLRERVGGGSRFVEGMMVAFLTYCVGPMTVVGSLRDGMGDPSIILAKSVMDGFVSVAYAAAMGVGVAFSAIPLLAFQGSLAALGALAGASLPERAVADMTAAGGLILLGLGINLLKLRRIRVGNMLPALAAVPLISYFLAI